MSKLPIVDAQTMERILLRLGFVVIRHKGSHGFYKHPDDRTTTVPRHRGCDLARPPLIREMLRGIELSPEDFEMLLRK